MRPNSPLPASAGAGTRGHAAVAVAIVATVVLAVIPAPSEWDTYGTRFAGLLLAAAIWLIAALLGGLRVPERRDLLVLAPGGVLALVIVAATLLGYAPAEMLTFGNGYYSGGLTWLAWLLIAMLATLARPSKAFRSGLLVAQLPAAAVSAVVIWEHRALLTAGFENSNHIVPGLLAMMPVSLGLAASSDSRGWRATSWVCALLAGAALVAQRSVSGVMGLAAILALCAVFAPRLLGARTPAAVRALRTIVAASVALAVVVVLLVALAPAAVPSFVNESLLGESVSSRAFYWSAALAAVAERPALGLGADGFEVMTQRLIDTSDGARFVLDGAFDWAPVAGDAHSLVITLLVSFGVVGFLVAAGLAAGWARSLLEIRREGAWSVFRSAVLVAVVAWFIGMLVLPLSVQWGGVPAMVFGLALVRPATTSAVHSLPSAKRGVLTWLSGLLALVLVIVSGLVVAGNASFAGASGKQSAEYFRALDRAVSLQPTMVYYRFVRLHSHGEDLTGEANALAAYQAAVDASGPAIREDARYMTVLVRSALDEAFVTGRTDLSWEENQLAALASRAPLLPELVMERAHLALLQGDAARALELLLRVKPYETRLARTALYRLYYALLTKNAEAAAELRQVVAAQGVPARLLPK